MEDFSKDQERFLRFVDGEMPEDERAQFQAALAADEGLRHRFRDYRKTVDMLHGLGRPKAPVTFLPGLQRHLIQRRGALPPARFPYEMLLFVLVMAGILYFYAAHMSPEPGAVARIVMVELTAPVPNEIATEFRLVERKDGAHTVAHVARLSEPQTLKLIEKLGPILSGKPEVPPGQETYEVILRPGQPKKKGT